jgi:hypothetical protein
MNKTNKSQEWRKANGRVLVQEWKPKVGAILRGIVIELEGGVRGVGVNLDSDGYPEKVYTIDNTDFYKILQREELCNNVTIEVTE